MCSFSAVCEHTEWMWIQEDAEVKHKRLLWGQTLTCIVRPHKTHAVRKKTCFSSHELNNRKQNKNWKKKTSKNYFWLLYKEHWQTEWGGSKRNTAEIRLQSSTSSWVLRGKTTPSRNYATKSIFLLQQGI